MFSYPFFSFGPPFSYACLPAKAGITHTFYFKFPEDSFSSQSVACCTFVLSSVLLRNVFDFERAVGELQVLCGIRQVAATTVPHY